MAELKVAIVHDWLTTMGGAEPVVLELHKLYPDAPIYTSVFNKDKMLAFADLDVRTTYLQKWLPKFVRYKHVLWPVLRSRAFRKLDLSEYDLIISSASAEAKSVIKKPGATHVCYCHTPTRYYWSHYEEFKNEFNFGPLTFLIRPLIPFFVKKMRKLDLQAAQGVDHFIANSTVTQARIKKYYGRESMVIHPPVDIERFKPKEQVERKGFIVWGRHVPYKRFDLAINACSSLGLQLTVVGSGPDTERLKKLAGPTILFPGRVSDEELVRLAHQSEAFLFPNEEDFGIAAVEALAAGLPVIAYKKGGALDIVEDGKTGIFFNEQTTESLGKAIQDFYQSEFSPADLIASANQFQILIFREKIVKSISQ